MRDVFFSETSTRSRHYEGRARFCTRGIPVVAIGTGSTNVKRSLKGIQRGRSQVKHLAGPAAPPHTNRSTPVLNSVSLPFALCLSVAHAVFSGTRASNAFVYPSYRRWRAALR